jgi:propane monooxygenase large subunit
MWKLSHVRGDTLASPLQAFRKLSPEDREKATAEYRKGFTINPCN